MRRAFVCAVVILAAACAVWAAERAVAPGFALKDQQGRVHSLQKLRGKVVVIDFGRVICIPCRKVIDDLNALDASYAKKGVAIYSVNLGVNPETLHQYIKDKKLTLPFLEDPEMRVTSKYGVQTIPYLVVIDKKGRIANTHLGYTPDFKKTMETEIKKLLAEKSN